MIPQKKHQKRHKSYHKKSTKKQIIPQKKSQIISRKEHKKHKSYHKKMHQKNTSHTTKKHKKSTNHITQKHKKKQQVIPQKNTKKTNQTTKNTKNTNHITKNTKNHKSYHKKTQKQHKSDQKNTKKSTRLWWVLCTFLCFLCFIFLLKIAGLRFSFVLKGSPPPPRAWNTGAAHSSGGLPGLCLPFYQACQSPALPSSFCLAAESPSLFDWIDIVDHFFTACAQMKKSIGLT